MGVAQSLIEQICKWNLIDLHSLNAPLATAFSCQPILPLNYFHVETMLPLFTFIVSTTLSCILLAEPIVGRVVGVADGDTLTVLDALKHQHKIRLSGIDAPEGGQAFGQRSKQALSDCAFGKQVTVDGDKLDRYGRTIGKVMVGNIDCNLRQAELGMAWHFKKYASERPPTENKRYAAAEDAARAAKRGLWADTRAMPPWEWRDGGQQAHAAAKESSGQCDCATAQVCTGKRGGSYCLTDAGKKRYLVKAE